MKLFKWAKANEVDVPAIRNLCDIQAYRSHGGSTLLFIVSSSYMEEIIDRHELEGFVALTKTHNAFMYPFEKKRVTWMVGNGPNSRSLDYYEAHWYRADI